MPVVLAALVAAALTSGVADGERRPPGSSTIMVRAGATAGAPPAGVSYDSMSFGGRTRSWRLFVPTVPRSPLPLLVLLHPAGGDPGIITDTTGMDAYAEAGGFVTVAPQGIGGTWNAGACCGQARDQGIDDVGFVNALIDRLTVTLGVDGGEVYAAGASNGGMLGYALACRLADRFEAVFSAAGAQTTQTCQPDRPVSVIEFHSAADATVPYRGGVDPAMLPTLTVFAPTADLLAGWVRSDGCASRSEEPAGGSVEAIVWSGCRDGTVVELWLRLIGGGHDWPRKPDAAVDASEVVAHAITSGALVRRSAPSRDPLAGAHPWVSPQPAPAPAAG